MKKIKIKKGDLVKVISGEHKGSDGSVVKIMETKPISKSKCWRIVEIIERAK